jgi:hypothetical protein
MKPTPLRQFFAAAVLSLSAVGAQASFSINLNFSGLTASQESYFTAAKSFWEGVITGYQGSTQLSGLTISATGTFIDGLGGTLSNAGPKQGIIAGGFAYTTAGSMSFDSADINAMIANGSFTNVITHEMAHAIGFGTLWNYHGLTSPGSGQYTGAAGLAAYRAEYNLPNATFVPVELGGGLGTANGHWNETDGGAGLTGTVDSQGRDMANELMTGWLNGPIYVSRTTIASFQDIGYNVAQAAYAPSAQVLAFTDMAVAEPIPSIPEPSAYALMLAGLAAVGFVARRRKSA